MHSKEVIWFIKIKLCGKKKNKNILAPIMILLQIVA